MKKTHSLLFTHLCWLGALLFFSAGLQANESDTDWKRFNLKLVKQSIIPGYQKLANEAERFHLANRSLCLSPSQENLKTSQDAFHASMDAWQAIQHVNAGPIEYAMRFPSLQFWPDKKNFIGKQLNRLITSEDETRLGERFNRASVAIKGFPAIERILFSQNTLEDLNKQPFRCKVLERITLNVFEISQSLAQEWPANMLPQFEDASQVDGYFEDDIDAATFLLKTIVEPIEIIRDLKLKRPLGSDLSKAKFKRLESWRSQRSLRNIRVNISALSQILPILNDAFPEQAIIALQHRLESIQNLLVQIPPPIEQSIKTEAGHMLLMDFSNRLTGLHESLENTVSQQGIHLGFNSRDGD